MKPHKAKDLIVEVAKELPYSSSTIEDVVNFYWREVWEALGDLRSPKVHVTNLGDFIIKHWALDRELNKYNKFEERTKLKGSEKYVAGLTIKESILKIERVQAEYLEEQQRKQFIYDHKKNKRDFERTLEPDLEGSQSREDSFPETGYLPQLPSQG